MNCKSVRLFLPVLLFLSGLSDVAAQSQQYSCDFEDVVENRRWVLNDGNDGASCANRWYIGQAGNNGGNNGLYISGDGGSTASYIGTPTFVAAYCMVTLPAGTYELSFDWQSWGINNDALYVLWLPASVQTSSVASGFKPKWFNDNPPVVIGDTVALYGDSWHTSYGTIVSDGSPHKLVFSWRNEQKVNNPAAAVDNIHIVPVDVCGKPEKLDLKSDSSSVVISWRGTSDTYDVRLLSSDGVWHEYPDLAATTLLVNDVPEGAVWVYVRGRCADGYVSSWTFGSTFVFVRGVRCLDYFDLAAADCWVGFFDNPRRSNMMIDDGYKSIKSQHTLHYDLQERDPRTDMKLRTVPDGAVASVRLGNWGTKKGAESIDYTYHVDEDASAVLLMQYAVVLQDPKHDKSQQPRFTLKVLHDDGSMIDEFGCGEADFFSGINTEGWDSVGPANDVVLWKDWTTVGINLRDYVGQDLIIRLTTYDCSEGGHYGYAYFVLGCSDGKILGLSCGESRNNSFRAPDGFRYRWYEKKDPDRKTLDTTQIFTTHRTDTIVYCCDVIQPTKGECYYTVEANATPRYPVADMSCKLSGNRCHNIVSFADSSYIMHVNPFTGDTVVAAELCDSVVWNFGDGTPLSRESNPVHVYPDKGGRFTVSLTAYLVECENTLQFDIDLPESGSISDTIYAVSCDSAGVVFGDEILYKEGWYTRTIVDYNGGGCDSIVCMYLTESWSSDTVITDFVCTGMLPYIFLGNEYTATGRYVHTLSNIHGCDSVVTLDLTVIDALNLTIPETVSACIDDGVACIPVNVLHGACSSARFVFDGMSDTILIGDVGNGDVKIPLPGDLLPGNYQCKVTFKDIGRCGDVTHALNISILYPDSIIAQRWNDVLAVKSAPYNGGYDFIAYQWYKDGMPVTGEVGSNIYEPDGLDVSAQYSVMLTRASDGVSAMTCDVQPRYFADVDITPTVVFNGSQIEVKCEVAGVARIWNMVGMLIGVCNIHVGGSYIAVPNVNGTYLIELILDDGSVRTEKIVVCGNK